MKQYIDLLKDVISNGEIREDRTGTGTISIFDANMKFDLQEKFPLYTIKKTLWRSAFIEMLWFLRAEPNTKFLKEHNVPIWDAWADKDGNLGPVYGVQWRRWEGSDKIVDSIFKVPRLVTYETMSDGKGPSMYKYREQIDQIKNLIDGIKNNPMGRRHIVSAWNPGFIDVMGLPPCHRDFQCYVRSGKYLDMKVAIRSNDLGLGNPFNVPQYALLCHLIARATELEVGKLSISIGDAHIYLNHLDAIKEMIETREPFECDTPRLIISTDNIDIDLYKIEDFDILGYRSHPFIKLPIAV